MGKLNIVRDISLQTLKELLVNDLIDPNPFPPKPKTKQRGSLHLIQEMVDIEGHSFKPSSISTNLYKD
jgi:hypothetical protein